MRTDNEFAQYQRVQIFSEPSIIRLYRLPKEIKRTVINRKTGLILASTVILAEPQLTKREKEILILIRQGFPEQRDRL